MRSITCRMRRFLFLSLVSACALLGWQTSAPAQTFGQGGGGASSSSSGLGIGGQGQGLTGQNLLGTTNITNIAQPLGTSKAVGPTQSNPFGGYYTNPYSLGINPNYSGTTNAGNSSQGTFGQPLYTTTTGSPSMGTFGGTTGGRTSAGLSGGASGGARTGVGGSGRVGGTGTSGYGSTGFGSTGTRTTGMSGYGTGTSGYGATGTSALGRPGGGLTGGLTGGINPLGTTGAMRNTTMMGANNGYFSTSGMVRSGSYVAGLGPTMPSANPVVSQLQVKLQGLLQASSSLPSKAGISVGMDGGGVVVLRGSVADDHERRLAEALMRLTPGVREVRNDLVVAGPAKNGGS